MATAIAGPIAFATAAKLAARRTNGYRPRDEPISALAARDCDGAPVMIPGFLALGAATLALGRLLRGSRLPAAVPAMMTAAGVTTALAGVARHSDQSCPSRSFGNENATLSDEVHIAVSFATFSMWVAMPLVTAAAGGNVPAVGRKLSFACGATALAGMVVAGVLVPRGMPRYSGTMQRMTLAGAFGFYPIAAAAVR